jgi:hypothetical protein
MKFGRMGRVAWYLCGVILVLSLPTFSYLIPKAELVMGPVIKPLAGLSGSQPAAGEDRFDRASSPLSQSARGSSSFVSSQPGATKAGAFRPGKTLERPGTPPLAALAPGGGNIPRAGMVTAAAVARGPIPSSVNQGRPRNAQSTYDTQAGVYPQDVSGFEQGYETAMGQLFQNYPLGFGGYRGNPFDDALPDDNGTGGDSNGDGGDNGGGDDQGGVTPPPPDQGGDDTTPPPPVDGGPPVKRYSFLVIGDFPGVKSTSKVFRAYREPDGSFVIEDKVRVNPFPGTVGGGNVLFPAENQQLVSDDVDGDGSLDLLVTEMTSQGTILHLLLGDASRSYLQPPYASALFLWKMISSVALLDFTGDGKLEVAVLFRNTSNLFVYTLEGGEFKYLEEIILPFEPSLVVDSQLEGFPKERRLHIFDASFYRVATLTSSNPGIFLLGLSGGQAFKTYKLEGEEDGPGETEVQVFEDSGGIALAENRGGSWVVLVRFSTTVRYPFAIFGDYLNAGTRQLICLP